MASSPNAAAASFLESRKETLLRERRLLHDQVKFYETQLRKAEKVVADKRHQEETIMEQSRAEQLKRGSLRKYIANQLKSRKDLPVVATELSKPSPFPVGSAVIRNREKELNRACAGILGGGFGQTKPKKQAFS
jgi:hypothetical protein